MRSHRSRRRPRHARVKLDVVMNAIAGFRRITTGAVNAGTPGYRELIAHVNAVCRLALRNVQRQHALQAIFSDNPLELQPPQDTPDLTAEAIVEVERIERAWDAATSEAAVRDTQRDAA